MLSRIKVNWRNEGTYSCKIRNIDKKKERDLSGKLTIRKKFRIMDGLANNTVYLSDDRPLQQSRTCKVDNAKEKLSQFISLFHHYSFQKTTLTSYHHDLSTLWI